MFRVPLEGRCGGIAGVETEPHPLPRHLPGARYSCHLRQRAELEPRAESRRSRDAFAATAAAPLAGDHRRQHPVRRGQRIEGFRLDEAHAVIRQDDVSPRRADVLHMPAAFGNRRQAEGEWERVAAPPLDLGNRLLLIVPCSKQGIYPRRHPRQAHRMSAGSVGIGPVAAFGADDFGEYEHVPRLQVGKCTEKGRFHRASRQAALIAAIGMEAHFIVGGDERRAVQRLEHLDAAGVGKSAEFLFRNDSIFPGAGQETGPTDTPVRGYCRHRLVFGGNPPAATRFRHKEPW